MDQDRKYAPTNFQKRLLVWFKKYPSMSDVPDVVS